MSDCQHRPRTADIDAGYEACMVCVETGECDGKKGWCRRHSVTWDVTTACESVARRLRPRPH